MEQDRYRTLPSGLKQKIWPGKETHVEKRQRLADERLRRRQLHYHTPRVVHQERGEIEWGRVEFERQPGEVDRGSSDYRIRMLIEGIKRLSKLEQSYQEDGWC